MVKRQDFFGRFGRDAKLLIDPLVVCAVILVHLFLGDMVLLEVVYFFIRDIIEVSYELLHCVNLSYELVDHLNFAFLGVRCQPPHWLL